MSRRKIRVPEPALLEIVAYPAAFRPVVITLENDYEITGEVNITQDVTLEQLWEVKQLLENIANAMADEIWQMEKLSVPFVPTGRVSPDGEHPTE